MTIDSFISFANHLLYSVSNITQNKAMICFSTFIACFSFIFPVSTYNATLREHRLRNRTLISQMKLFFPLFAATTLPLVVAGNQDEETRHLRLRWKIPKKDYLKHFHTPSPPTTTTTSTTTTLDAHNRDLFSGKTGLKKKDHLKDFRTTTTATTTTTTKK